MGQRDGDRIVRIAGTIEDQKPRGADALLDNFIVCHCTKESPHSPDWWVVQDWWREHGFGRACHV